MGSVLKGAAGVAIGSSVTGKAVEALAGDWKDEVELEKRKREFLNEELKNLSNGLVEETETKEGGMDKKYTILNLGPFEPKAGGLFHAVFWKLSEDDLLKLEDIAYNYRDVRKAEQAIKDGFEKAENNKTIGRSMKYRFVNIGRDDSKTPLFDKRRIPIAEWRGLAITIDILNRGLGKKVDFDDLPKKLKKLEEERMSKLQKESLGIKE